VQSRGDRHSVKFQSRFHRLENCPSEVDECLRKSSQPELYPNLLFIVFVTAIADAHPDAVKLMRHNGSPFFPFIAFFIITDHKLIRPSGVGKKLCRSSKKGTVGFIIIPKTVTDGIFTLIICNKPE
jgi:hypothetical protein